jgi:hypothetical protein
MFRVSLLLLVCCTAAIVIAFSAEELAAIDNIVERKLQERMPELLRELEKRRTGCELQQIGSQCFLEGQDLVIKNGNLLVGAEPGKSIDRCCCFFLFFFALSSRFLCIVGDDIISFFITD